QLQAAIPPLEPSSRQRHRHRRQARSAEPGAARLRDADRAYEDHRVRAAPARARRPHVPRGDLGPQHPDAQLRRLRPQLGEAVRVRGRCGAALAEGDDRASHRLPRHDVGQQESGRSAQLGGRRPAIDREHVHRSRLLGLAHRRTVPGRDGQAPREDEEPERLRHRLSALLGAGDPDRAEVNVKRAKGKVQSTVRVAGCAVTIAVAFALVASVRAQTRFTYSSGQSVSPAYEGWMPNADGSFTMYFGYMNTNWLEEFDIPVGAAHDLEPAGPDRGQPAQVDPRPEPVAVHGAAPMALLTR